MIKKYKLILISVLSLIAAVCLFAGCHLNENKTFDEFVTEKNLKANVVYILNDGTFKNKSSVFNMYYKAGAKPYEITLGIPAGGSIGNAQIDERNGYTFDGWYLAETSDGYPVYEDGTPFDSEKGVDSEKAVKASNEKYNFDTLLEEGERIYLVARWTTDSRLIVKLVTEGYNTLIKDDAEYKTGDEINSYPIPDRGIGNIGDMVFTAKGYTFVSFYTDETAATRFDSWPVTTPDEGDVTIYAKFIEGDWVIVENTSGITRMFGSGGTSRNYYFLNDVDCSELRAQSPRTQFLGTIKGNGFAIQNLKLNVSSALTTEDNASLFGNIAASAVIEDITFENLKTTCSVRSNADPDKLFFFCQSVDEKATLNNVNLSGKLSITLNNGSMLTNTTEAHWIFGGVKKDADMKGVTLLDGTTCKITDAQGNVVNTYVKSN
ncbi:MAG: InlB B-repeat-containing protein [Clostridia bacterium]|nr:InlB B-repeat-containing protein [Clostridia bacterium]